MVQKQKKPAAVMSSPPATDGIEHARDRTDIKQRFWRTVDRIRERNADKNPEEEMAFITGVVEEVRQERYDAAHRKDKGRR